MQFRYFLVPLFMLLSVQAVFAQSPAWQQTTRHEFISSIDLSSDGSVIAAGSTMGTLAVFDKAGRMQWNITFPGTLLVDVSPDGSMIVTGSRESMEKDKGTVRAYDRTGRAVWLNNTGWITELAAAGDPLRVAVGTRRGTAEVYDAKGKLVKMYSNFPLLDVVKKLGISADGKSIAFSLFSRKPVFKLANVTRGSVSSPALFGDHIALSANGSAIAVADGEGSRGDLYLYAANGTRLWNLNTGDVNDLAISANGACVITGEEDGTVTCYNRTGNVSWTYRTEGPVNSLSITPNATLVAVGSADEHVYLLDGNGVLVWEYNDDEALENPVNMVRLSADGRSLVAVAGGTDLLYFPIDAALTGATTAGNETNATVNAGNSSGVTNTPGNSTQALGNTTANATPGRNSTRVLGNTTSGQKTNTSGNATTGWNSSYFASLRYPGTGKLPWLAAWHQLVHVFERG